jgi:hypothetical protein
MSDTPKLDNPVYSDVDLGDYDPELAGRKLRVLQNPSFAFRQSFIRASIEGAGDWRAHLPPA